MLTGVLSLVLAIGVVVFTGNAADAEEPSELTIVARASFADTAATLAVVLVAAGHGVEGASVILERSSGSSWAPLGQVTTDSDGVALFELIPSRDPADNRVRATFEGDATYLGGSTTAQVPLRRRTSRVTLGGPGSFVDETEVSLTARWHTRSGDPVAGRLLLQRKLPGDKDWQRVQALQTGKDGVVQATVSPREDSRWRVVASALPWVSGGRSAVHSLDNLPPIDPVRLLPGAPRPRHTLPAQGHALGKGANPVVTKIPNGTWRQMTGRSWHAGCPVGRPGLRLLRINYWDFTGYRRRGELVAAVGVINQMAGALRDMYQAELPIRSMRRVDHFGWSRRLRGANDYASMAADNTSAFNCREVVGRPGVRSPHSYGRSLDINPWENPYHSPQGTYPNTWWPSRSHPQVAWRSRGHIVVRIMARHGLRWTYGLSDAHHFDAVPRSGRPLRLESCTDVVCH